MFYLIIRQPPFSSLFPYTTLFRSDLLIGDGGGVLGRAGAGVPERVKVAEIHAKAGYAEIDLGRRDFSRFERSEEHTSELQSQFHLVCRLLLEKKNNSRNYKSTLYY